MNDDDIRAFGPVPGSAPAPAPAPAARRRRWWPWAVGGLVLLMALLAASAAAALLGLGDSLRHGLHVAVDGDSWDVPVLLDTGDWGLALLGVAVALLALMLVVPLALLLGLAAAALGIGIAVLVVLTVAAVVLSPLWLAGLLLWLLLRQGRPAAARMPA